MGFWQRLAVTILVVLAFSGLLHIAWQALLGFAMPAYLAGLLGGLVALPVWEYLQLRRRNKTA
jgi:hypothetical protein